MCRLAEIFRSRNGIEKLKRLPRYQRGSFSFGKYTVKYIDSLSFYNEYCDIFKNRIYHFITSKSKPVIYDAGGYIGLSVLYFKHIYPEAMIKVFEPDPSVFKILNENVKSNHLNAVELFNVGLGKTEEKVPFYPDNSDGGSIFEQDNIEPIKVKIVRLSDYISEPIDLLKMNIEGTEGEVFEEIEEKLSLIKEIIFEYHCFYNLNQNLGNILNILDRNHFRYVVTDTTNAKIRVPFNLPSNYRFFNLVYAKKMSMYNERKSVKESFDLNPKKYQCNKLISLKMRWDIDSFYE